MKILLERYTRSPSGEHSGEWRQIPYNKGVKSFCRKFGFEDELKNSESMPYYGGQFSMILCGFQ